MRLRNFLPKTAALLLVFGLAACGGKFRTYYDTPASKDWVVTGVTVSTPRTLSISEAETFIPRADIVWREDPPGDRYAQVEKIMTDAVRQGAAAAKGSRPVRLELTMTRFHAMTFKAETRAPAGVHDIEFDLSAYDARSGARIYGPEHIEASFPAMTGAAMAQARAQGETQKSQITQHVARTIAGWLGAAPDPRRTFSSVGG